MTADVLRAGTRHRPEPVSAARRPSRSSRRGGPVTPTGSVLTHLECTACGAVQDADKLHRLCPSCDKVLYPRYDLDAAARSLTRDALVGREPSMWRYREVLPVRST